jgi:hypothetical protein
MQLVAPSHGFYCDFTHFPTPSSYDPFHSLAHVTNKQGMVYGYCEKCLSECIGNGESKPYTLPFSIVKIGSSRICFQKCFEHELKCFKVCLDIVDLNLNLCDSYSKSSNYTSNGLQFHQ